MLNFDAESIRKLLDEELRLSDFRDVSRNGLQIANRGEITKIVTGVDATLEFFQDAIDARANMVIVHHGISWGESLAQITDLNYELVSFAIKNNLALYAAHLPLDAHPILGNNAQIAQALNLRGIEPFMDYHGMKIGFKGVLPRSFSREDFSKEVSRVILPERFDVMPFGNDEITTIGICSGGAPEGVIDAAKEGLDAYLCGEPNLVAYNAAKQLEINAFFAGHYATERFGVRALGNWLYEKTSIDVEFIDFKIPY